MNATHFTYQLLRDAMSETIASLNAFAREAGISEVYCQTLFIVYLMPYIYPAQSP